MIKNIAVQGICFDKKSSYLQGTNLAPPLIRKKLWSSATNTFSEIHKDIKNCFSDLGDFKPNAYKDISSITKKSLQDSNKLLTLGGDHSITFPIIKEFIEVHKNFDIIHFDAHPDLYDKLQGDKYSHACPFARIMESGFSGNLIQIGIRTWTTHQIEQAKKFNIPINDIKNFKFDNSLLKNEKLYISLDMDAFDPAYAPGVSHPEPGGLSSRDVINIIQELKGRMIGADIVECNPKRDINGLTSILAAKLMKEILSKMDERS